MKNEFDDMNEKCPKVYAIYLPQFHQTPHNDEWWGEGFTDWNAVKSAIPFFQGHKQPHIPAKKNYYDLLDRDTLESQARIAKKYGVDGFIFYHYYFGNGKMELEKPAEKLLTWKEIDIPFCFSWANQSWIRTWSRLAGNVWGEKFEAEKKDDSGILVEQKYGDEFEWEQHFYYLLPFFKDERYIRINNCPVFIIYNPSEVGCMRQMISFWRKLALVSGLEGLFIIGYNTYTNNVGFDALMMHEPGFSIRKLNKISKVQVKNGVRCIDYSDFWENTIASTPAKNTKTYFTGACGYDTTPRRGKNGECLINRSPALFQKYFTELLQKSIYYGNEFVVINAWNEWGEGMYLEADEEDGYEYLEAISSAKSSIDRMTPTEIQSITTIIEGYGEREDEQEFLLSKFQYYFKVCSKWIDKLNTKNSLFCDFLNENGINTIAIYGFADIGRKLLLQLRKEGVTVKYAIDQYVGSISGDIEVFRPEDELPKVDAIIITAYDPAEIREILIKKGSFVIFSILELLER